MSQAARRRQCAVFQCDDAMLFSAFSRRFFFESSTRPFSGVPACSLFLSGACLLTPSS